MNNSTIHPQSIHRPPSYLYISPSLGSLISLHAIINNLKLLVQQRSVSSWFDEDRPLIIGALLANTVSSLAHLCFFLIDICHILRVVKNGTDFDWIEALADMGALISTLYVGALSFRSFYTIRAHLKSPDADKVIKKKWVLVAHLAWPLAFILALVGINADHSAIFNQLLLPHLVSDISYYMLIILLQLAVMLLLLKTRQYSAKVQSDFVVNRAQQSLRTRVSLSHTIKRTKILIPQLAINAFLWIVLLGINFIIDQLVERHKDTSGESTQDENPFWASCLDCIEALIYMIFPMLLTRKPNTPVGQQILRAITCHYDLKAEQVQNNTVANASGVIKLPSGPKQEHGAHWKAMDDLWQKVENTKGMVKGREGKNHCDEAPL